MGKIPVPDTILEVVLVELDPQFALTGVHAGYEDASWRLTHLVDDLIKWCADWVLTRKELEDFNSANGVELFAKALSRVYKTHIIDRRGEPGELLLHILLRKIMASERAISRIYLKDAANDTVKGFDGVHVVEIDGDDLELWLGESKFYASASGAATAAVDSLREHLAADYLRTEFLAISDKLDETWEHTQAIKDLVAQRRSLDDIFQSIVIPIFATYDSDVTARHDAVSEAYVTLLQEELRQQWAVFRGSIEAGGLPRKIRAHLFLLPTNTKKALLLEFDRRLKVWQATTST